jgi:hypothetical protein
MSSLSHAGRWRSRRIFSGNLARGGKIRISFPKKQLKDSAIWLPHHIPVSN